MADIKETLDDRGSTYGAFSRLAYVAQSIKKTLTHELSCNVVFMELRDEDKTVVLESLDLIATKLARISNGNPTHVDNFRDIAGYALLTTDYLEELEKKHD